MNISLYVNIKIFNNLIDLKTSLKRFSLKSLCCVTCDMKQETLGATDFE